jgi:hypothetical protein
MTKIKLSRYIINKCILFAGARLSDSERLYMRRAPTDKLKIHSDLLAGIIGEYGAYEYLKSIGIAVKKPDLALYTVGKKSFNADLAGESVKFHVKSQTSESVRRYGHSWVLQKTDPMLSKPSSTEYLLFTEVSGNEITILGIANVKEMVDNGLVGVCKVPMFAKTKVALYLEDLKPIIRSTI